jgi:hypothetical protein
VGYFGWARVGRGMTYTVRARFTDGRGSFTTTHESREAALICAKECRKQGFRVIVIGPDGEPVDETEDE